MKEKGKWTPHIIAAMAFAVFIVLGLACASSPNPAINDSMMDNSLSIAEQSQIYVNRKIKVSIDHGDMIIASSDGKETYMGEGTVFILPAGEHNFTGEYTYYGSESSGGSYTVMVPRGKVSFNIDYNLLPGQFYYLLGADDVLKKPEKILLLTDAELSSHFSEDYVNMVRRSRADAEKQFKK